MPGRVSARSSTASRLTSKSSTQTLASRRSTTSTTVAIPEEGPESILRTQISSIFRDAQRTTAGHRKLVVGLRKTQETCAYEPHNGKGGRQDFGEDEFNAEFARCVVRLLGVKRSEGAGDRLVRFVGFFLRHASEKGMTLSFSCPRDADHMQMRRSFQTLGQMRPNHSPKLPALV